MTVGQLTAQLSEEELVEWQAYDRLDPIGAYRSDVQTALLAYMQSGSKDATLDDFILFDPEPRPLEEIEEEEKEAQKAKLQAQAQAMKEYFEYLSGSNCLPSG